MASHAAPPRRRSLRLSPLAAGAVPTLFGLGMAGLGLTASVRQQPTVLWSLLGAAVALFAGSATLWVSAARAGRHFTLDIAPKTQHYLQACAQGAVFAYWGWYWPEVYSAAPLIAAQLVFAYAVDMLVSWSQRDHYVLGFGPFPVVFSINLFLWFKPDWFYLQFFMVAFGFAAKDFIRWQKDGRSAHIFNPSAFALALFSVALLITGQSAITWGKTIALTQFYPPHIYLVLFLVGLPGQILFGVTTMTMAAVVSTYLFGLAYFAVTGVYFFYDSYIPIAVFLGMHLLFTDPSTSPRTELGRIIFGALYGLSTVALYSLLGRAGLPTFYDKLLQVPLLNLSIKALDRAAQSPALRVFDPGALGRTLPPRARNLVYVAVWTLVVGAMSAAQGIGDSHPGQWLPFWQRACREGRPGACGFLVARLSAHCADGSGWACNEASVIQTSAPAGGSGESHAEQVTATVVGSLERGCALGFAPACQNVLTMLNGGRPGSAPPVVEDLPIILRGSKQGLTNQSPSALFALACAQGWPNACEPGGAAARP